MRVIAGEVAGVLQKTPPIVLQLRQVLDDLRSFPIEERLIRAHLAVDRPDKYLHPAMTTLLALGTTTNGRWERKLEGLRRPLIVCTLEQPDSNGDSLIDNLLSGGIDHVQNSVLSKHLCHNESGTEQQSPLVAPIVVMPAQTLRVNATKVTTNLTTGSLIVRGFTCDAYLARAVELAGELSALSLAKTYSAAAVMGGSDVDDVVRQPLDVERLVAKETLSGDAAFSAFSLKLPMPRGADGFKESEVELAPFNAAIPPSSVKHAGARVFMQLRPQERIAMQPRYTSAGGAGTAALTLSFIGRRVFC